MWGWWERSTWFWWLRVLCGGGYGSSGGSCGGESGDGLRERFWYCFDAAPRDAGLLEELRLRSESCGREHDMSSGMGGTRVIMEVELVMIFVSSMFMVLIGCSGWLS